MKRLETLIELKFLNSICSSSNFSIWAFRASPRVETRQTAPCRAIWGKSSDSRRQYLSQQYPRPLLSQPSANQPGRRRRGRWCGRTTGTCRSTPASAATVWRSSVWYKRCGCGTCRCGTCGSLVYTCVYIYIYIYIYIWRCGCGCGTCQSAPASAATAWRSDLGGVQTTSSKLTKLKNHWMDISQ